MFVIENHIEHEKQNGFMKTFPTIVKLKNPNFRHII